MGTLAIGEIVLVDFPFSDLTYSKLRPALVVGIAEFNDYILCQITSKPYSSKIYVEIDDANFSTGSLAIKSFIRPDKLFTADSKLIKKKLAKLNESTAIAVKTALRDIFEF